MMAVTATLWAVTVFVGVPLCTPSSDMHTIIISLSSKNLSSVPRDLPPSVEALDLSCNNIHKLGRQDFENTSHLRFLNLSWNAVEEIKLETFRPTPLLEDLDLSHNRLQNLTDQRYLLLTQNLRILDLTFNRFHTMTLGREFCSLAKLEHLGLGANVIAMQDFENIANMTLQTLTLRLENLANYESGSLRLVQAKLVRVAVTNKATDRPLFADILLMFGEVELMGMKGDRNYLAELVREREVVNTSHLYLTNMVATWMYVTDTINAVLRSPIGHLSASDLAISSPPRSDTPVSKTSLMKSFSVRRAFVLTFFFSQEALYDFFINMPVGTLSMRETPIIHMTCPQSDSAIHHLDFSDCALTDTVFSRVERQVTLECMNFVELYSLVLKGNNLKSLQVLSKRVQYIGSLRHLDLSLNSLAYDGLEQCLWPPNIIKMNLSSNGLSQSVFSCLPNGTNTLDLQNNQITIVPEAVMGLDSLLFLDLSANRLRDLPVCSGFPNLKVLLLRENSLHAPSVSFLESCPRLQDLDASLNPFTCTCTLRAFQGLGAGATLGGGHPGITLLRWPRYYRCSYPETWKHSTLKDFRMPEISCNIGLLMAAILCPAVVVIVAVATLCHRLDGPWYMGMIWKWTRAKHRARTQQIKPEDLEGVEFHAFVSYSQHDADWVNDSLLPNLEGPAGGLHICRHERDFVPGKTIVENIIRCVEKSRRCVFVLSSHFVRSEWCHYELYFASHQRLLRGSDSVILVLLEPLPQYLIPSKYNQLKAMMSRHTYLEWPQDRGKHRLFWANLRAALQSDLPAARVREAERERENK